MSEGGSSANGIPAIRLCSEGAWQPRKNKPPILDPVFVDWLMLLGDEARHTVRYTEPGTTERYDAVNWLVEIQRQMLDARIELACRADPLIDRVVSDARDLINATVATTRHGGKTWREAWDRLNTHLVEDAVPLVNREMKRTTTPTALTPLPAQPAAPAPTVSSPPRCKKRAWSQYNTAAKRHPELAEHGKGAELYEKAKEMAEAEGEEIPDVGTWLRYIRDARRHYEKTPAIADRNG
jgi:hypothetical protein